MRNPEETIDKKNMIMTAAMFPQKEKRIESDT